MRSLWGELRARRQRWSCAPDGRPRPDAPFARGPVAARVLGSAIDAAVWAGCRLPDRVAHGFAAAGGHAEWAFRPGKRRQLAANIAHAVGAPPRSRRVRGLVRREIVNEARRSADLLWAIGRRREFLATVDIVGRENPALALDRGHGVVLCGVHVGGWEVATSIPAMIVPAPTTVIVADDWLAWGIQHIREDVGLRTVYRSSPALASVRVLRRNEALLVLGDDATGAAPRTYRVPFCDAEADLPAGVVTLARLTGAAIVLFSMLPVGRRRWKAVLEPPIDPPDPDGGDEAEAKVLTEIAERWTALVQNHPEHWSASFPISWHESPTTPAGVDVP